MIIGVVDAVEVVDEDGSRRLMQRRGGLTFRVCNPENEEATTLGRLVVRPGGMVVFVQPQEDVRGFGPNDWAAQQPESGDRSAELEQMAEGQDRPAEGPSDGGSGRRRPKPAAA